MQPNDFFYNHNLDTLADQGRQKLADSYLDLYLFENRQFIGFPDADDGRRTILYPEDGSFKYQRVPVGLFTQYFNSIPEFSGRTIDPPFEVSVVLEGDGNVPFIQKVVDIYRSTYGEYPSARTIIGLEEWLRRQDEIPEVEVEKYVKLETSDGQVYTL